MSRAPAIVVIAKEPVPGRVKTRLSPPFTPAEAAGLAAAALADTLIAVAAAPAGRRILALDGSPGPWLPPGFKVVPQVHGGLDERIGAAAETVGGPVLVVGMDTPQLTAGILAAGIEALMDQTRDAVLGPATDGGYWAIGLRWPKRSAIAGVPMSVSWTAAAQRRRFEQLCMSWTELGELRDVDTDEDAYAVAADAPRTRFAARLREIPAQRPAIIARAG